MSKKKTTYYGFKNVPVGVLVVTKGQTDRDDVEDLREFYFKVREGLVQGAFAEGDTEGFIDIFYNPDDFTTGKYRAV